MATLLECAMADLGVKEISPGENPRILAYWAAIGLHPQHDEGLSWCAAALHTWLKEAGLNPPSGMKAGLPGTYRTYGTALPGPVVGCLAIKKANKHIAVVTEVRGAKIKLIGGAQAGHAVTISAWQAASAFDSWRMPP